MRYLINGGNKLTGNIHISGNKNSVFPCVAAALLTSDEVILENASNLKDTEILIHILKKLGAKVKRESKALIIQSENINQSTLPKDLMIKLRGSIVLVGALLGRLGKVHFYHPGGDVIGQRSIETHLEGFKLMGANLKREDLKFMLNFDESSNKTCQIFLTEASVTATENLILASVLGRKTVILKNCSREPHILDLCQMLKQMGAKIKEEEGALVIEGVERLNGTKFSLGIDYVELGTYIVAAAITRGRVKITGLNNTDIDPVIVPLGRFGIKIERDGNSIVVWADKLKSIPKLTTNIWPGFPTDLMSVAIVLASQSKGVTLCHDWMYESRMFFVDKLISMGAQISLADPHRVFVYGPSKLRGRELSSPDIRAGMALVLASLVARGKSVINQAELIERGYEQVVEKLRDLGADIKREVN